MNTVMLSLGVLAQMGLSVAQLAAQDQKMNILFIAVDDLKPVLGCYGDTLIKTPNIDRLAARGTVFVRNYCQQAVCGPTRASLMTGLRPDNTGVWDLKTRMRDVHPDILSLPQYFRTQGYTTRGIGKIYDQRCVDEGLDSVSWSAPYYRNSDEYFAKETGAPEQGYQLPETKELIRKHRADGRRKGLKGKELAEYVQTFVRPSVECINVPDHAYADGAMAVHARDIITELSEHNAPFFFAVGFSKPHLPFVAPKQYWDLYKREQMPVAPYRQGARNGPELAYHRASELYAYSDIPPLASFSDQKGGGLDIPPDKQRELIHGYYAATSYTDAHVGTLLNALDSLGLRQNTIIVLWGDHGWHLGDHNLWCKHTNFEQATHSPLLISAPWIDPSKTSSPTEFIDVFPTVCDLAGVPIPLHLDGKSLVQAMKEPETRIKEFAVSQYPRTHNTMETERLGYSDGEFMGYSIRTDRYRYTVWMKDNFRSTRPFSKDLIVASELYDYEQDPNETVNVVAEEEYSPVLKDVHEKMLRYFRDQTTRERPR